MRFLTRLPLRITLPVFLFLTAFILLIFNMQLDMRTAGRNLEEESVSELIQDMTLIQGVLNNLSRKGDVEGIQAVFADVGAKPHITLALLVDKTNRVINSNDMRLIGKPFEESLPEIDMQELSYYRKNIRGVVSFSSSGDFLYGYYPVVLNAQMEGLKSSSMGILHMRYDMTGLKVDLKYEIQQRMFQGIFYYSIVFFSLGLLLRIIITKRVERIVSAVQKFSDGDSSARANLGGKDELSNIASAFNNMAEQILTKQRAMSESEEQHTTVLKTAMDGFTMVDMNGRYLEVNEAYCRMTGYSEEELLGMSVTDLEAAEASEETKKHIEAIRDKWHDFFESKQRRKDGWVF